ncbi:uncharacterized protein LAESUDRAFT_317825 [Laetiporus sulphureus 93-53]|uniref:Uncharacterized protein n=1 Tax=Laetiporus sulphureus 93-53 TaxID=1314785 RepID=A0A165D0X7_9APHY|nr:uncharacterized protein LAESUDRAFT_317825 [Laetiporus sulphureus 93-53]KZT03913.1 hypothetical protein LAESUDRAFT_317825 [Laetiporus sulphureus 93-53]
MRHVLQSLKVRLLSTRRNISLRAQGVDSLEGVRPLFERKPPWYIRGAYFFVAANIFTVFTFSELTWTHWTRWEPLPASSQTVKSKAEPKGDSKEPRNGHYVLRPWYQRLFVTAGPFVIGLGLAAFIITGRLRIVHKLYLLPSGNPATAAASIGATKSSFANSVSSRSSKTKQPASPPKPVDDRRVVLQSAAHWRKRGLVFPIRNCKLEVGTDKNELKLFVEGYNVPFWVSLDGATIDGQKGSIDDSRVRLFKAWVGEKGAMRILKDEHWISGPKAA